MPADASNSNLLASDDPEAWSTLVAAANPAAMMVVIANRLGPDLARQLAPEDILQETLLKAWRSRAEVAWHGLPSFRRWLLRIAEHCVEDQRDRLRADKRGAGRAPLTLHARHDSDGSASGAGGFEPWSSTTPSRVAHEREMMGVMQEALAGLPDELREVVRLRLFEDLLVEEIAAQIGLGESAVRHRFRKGAELYRHRLRAALGLSALPKALPDPDAHTEPASTGS